jgi:hypothetical protein
MKLIASSWSAQQEVVARVADKAVAITGPGIDEVVPVAAFQAVPGSASPVVVVALPAR